MEFLHQASVLGILNYKRSLQEMARLPVAERHKILEPFIAATAEDFLNDPELTEFAILDGEDWKIDLTKEEL